MAARTFPLFLVPAEGVDPGQLPSRTTVEVGIQDGAWLLRERGGGRVLFSFDLPDHLFELYARNGRISPNQAVDLKARYLSEIHAFVVGDDVRAVSFSLDFEWLNEVRARIAEVDR